MEFELILKRKTEDENKMKNSKLTSKEEMKSGSVGYKVYLDYVKAIGVIGTLVTILSYMIANGFTVQSSVWLSDWSNDANKNATKTISTHQGLKYMPLSVLVKLFLC